jgi:glycogen debranching enzyme
MHKIFGTIFLILMAESLTAQTILYRSPQFEITNQSVRQGPYEAKALSATSLSSTYASQVTEPADMKLEFKFSINGGDNEMPFGANHVLEVEHLKGRVETPVFEWGQQQVTLTNEGTKVQNVDTEQQANNLQVTFKLNLKPVLQSFEKNGYYEFYNGQRINKEDFKGVYIAGNKDPLTWDFINLPSRRELQLNDNNNDGVYEVTLSFDRPTGRQNTDGAAQVRNITRNLSQYPQYKSNHLLADALYTMSLEETLLNIRPDSAFMAGEKWEGVWTRDISYSIHLSLAAINPDVSKKSLLKKVHNKRIIQDTGTGGSWPVSSDRTTWAVAAWEVYLVTGERQWLEQSFEILNNSVREDLLTVYDAKTGLFYGESSFLDWREQTYPRWMESKDIYQSFSLGTNAVHYQTYRILEQMAKSLGKPTGTYTQIAEGIRKGINTLLWSEKHGYYGQFLYGGKHMMLSPRSEALGESLCVLFDIPSPARIQQVVKSTPVMAYGTPSIYPQIPNILPYHNNSVWPFVQAYWTWASAKAQNSEAVEQAIASMYRQGALFLTNKENMVAATGDFNGTVINSDRQLWSVAGQLAMVYRVFYGMQYEENRLVFKPFVPEPYQGRKQLSNFRYRGAVLDVRLNGFGQKIREVRLNGRLIPEAVIPANLKGKHTLEITLDSEPLPASKIKMSPALFSPETPEVTYQGGTLNWQAIEGALNYEVYFNGEKMATTAQPVYKPQTPTQYGEWQVVAIDAKGVAGFYSKPLEYLPTKLLQIIPADSIARGLEKRYSGYTGHGYIVLDRSYNKALRFQASIPEAGTYYIDARYANGNGPINTENKCAIRSLFVNGKMAGKLVMPQRGDQAWQEWGFTNWVRVELTPGTAQFEIQFAEGDENMNININQANLDMIRLIKAN